MGRGKGKGEGKGERGWGGEGDGKGERGREMPVFEASCDVRQNNQPTNGMPAFRINLVPCCACS